MCVCVCVQLQVLNLGNNEFEEFPQLLQHLHSLEKLHFFGNKLADIAPASLSECFLLLLCDVCVCVHACVHACVCVISF